MHAWSSQSDACDEQEGLEKHWKTDISGEINVE